MYSHSTIVLGFWYDKCSLFFLIFHAVFRVAKVFKVFMYVY